MKKSEKMRFFGVPPTPRVLHQRLKPNQNRVLTKLTVKNELPNRRQTARPLQWN